MALLRLLLFSFVLALVTGKGNHYYQSWSSLYTTSYPYVPVTMSPPYRSNSYPSTTTTTPSPSYSSNTISYLEQRRNSVPNSMARWRTYFLHTPSTTTTTTTTTPMPYISHTNFSSKSDSITPTMYWLPRCPYPRDPCGIENQPLMGSEFEPGFAVAGSEYQKVMILDTNHAPSSAARLITPYIKSRNREQVCLKLEYLLQDAGVEKLSIIQQDRRETRTIYTVSGPSRRDKWRVAKMDIVLREGIARYFLEVRLDKANKGLAMIKSFEYTPGSCSNEYTDDTPQYEFYKRSRLMSKYFELY